MNPSLAEPTRVVPPRREARGSPPDSYGLDAGLVKARVKARLLGAAPSPRLGRFELLRRLGVGGEGSVFEARDLHSGALVALKRLHQRSGSSALAVTREFRALAGLVHPNLVTLHELFCVESSWFYTMERIEGVDLVRHVRRDAPDAFDAQRLRTALAQLLCGVAAIHAAGKLHRDLKPGNVLVRADGRVVILDYGMVAAQRAPDVGPTALRVSGTPAYLAPEQASGCPEPASDLYAIGVMLYQALTGELPFKGSPGEVLAAKQRERAPSPSALGASAPADLEELCRRLLEPDPAARPDAAAALAALGGGRPPPLPRASASRKPALFVGRERELAALRAAADARGHAPTFVLLQGESGVGKSALLARFCSELRARRACVVEGRCYERENTPFRVLEAVADQLVRELDAVDPDAARRLLREHGDQLAQLFPALARRTGLADGSSGGDRIEAGERRARAGAAMRTLLRELAGRCELVLAVDDLQWGDLDSIALLQHVFTGPDAPAVLLLGAYRSVEVDSSPFLKAALGGTFETLPAQLFELTLEPLPQVDADALLRSLAGAAGTLTERARNAALAQARGLPFALQLLAEQALDEPGEGISDAPLHELLERRAAGCSTLARELLRLLCIAGRPLDVTLALRACRAGPDGWPAAHELCASRLARWRDVGAARHLEPYHDLIRAALVRGVGPLSIRRSHAAMVEALEALGIDEPEHLVDHLLGAGAVQRAGEVALVAAERARQQLAWNRSAELLGKALGVLAPDDARRPTLRLALADALAAADRHREAAAAYLEAAEADPSERQRLRALAVSQRMRAGSVDEGYALLEQLLSEIGLRLPRSQQRAAALYLAQRARSRFDRSVRGGPSTRVRSRESQGRVEVLAAAYTELWQVDPTIACVIHNWFLREASAHRDGAFAQALTWEIMHLAVQRGPAISRRLEQLLAQLDELAAELGSPLHGTYAKIARAIFLLHCAWKPRAALSLLDAAEAALAQTPGKSFERLWIALGRELALEQLGDYAELIASITSRKRESLARDDGYSSNHLAVSLPTVFLIQDRPEASLAYLRPLRAAGPTRNAFADYWVAVNHSSALSYQGEHRRAHASLHEDWAHLRRTALLASRVVQTNAAYHLARNAIGLYATTGEPEPRREALSCIRQLRRMPPLASGLVELLLASLARADGDRACSRRHLTRAMEVHARVEAAGLVCCAQYGLACLAGDLEARAGATAWLRTRGIRSPERWLSLCLPGASNF